MSEQQSTSSEPNPTAGARRERPILFSAKMVRAILDGRKTQTRRVVKDHGKAGVAVSDGDCGVLWNECPYGSSGDRLWVRETFQQNTPPSGWLYRADDVAGHINGGWRPSIFMPRQASRITLEIVDVRVERLQDISDTDSIREGIPDYPDFTGDSPVHDFSAMWESINGRGSWELNPWVWVIEFKRVNTNPSGRC